MSVRPIYEEGERQIGNRHQAIVTDAGGNIVYACDHPHPAWEDASDCAHLWILRKAQETPGMIPSRRK